MGVQHPKRLRIYFMYDRNLLSKLSRCAWRVLSVYLRQFIPDDSAASGAAIAVQTFDEFQNFNPHLHAIASDGCFSDNGVFQVAPGSKPRDLEDFPAGTRDRRTIYTTVATAIADRLVYNSDVLIMEGPSYRKRMQSQAE